MNRGEVVLAHNINRILALLSALFLWLGGNL